MSSSKQPLVRAEVDKVFRRGSEEIQVLSRLQLEIQQGE